MALLHIFVKGRINRKPEQGLPDTTSSLSCKSWKNISKSKQREMQAGLGVCTAALTHSSDKPPFRWACRSVIYPEHRCKEIALKTFWRTLSLVSLHDQKDPSKENKWLGVSQNGVFPCRDIPIPGTSAPTGTARPTWSLDKFLLCRSETFFFFFLWMGQQEIYLKNPASATASTVLLTETPKSLSPGALCWHCREMWQRGRGGKGGRKRREVILSNSERKLCQ